MAYEFKAPVNTPEWIAEAKERVTVLMTENKIGEVQTLLTQVGAAGQEIEKKAKEEADRKSNRICFSSATWQFFVLLC